jgi:hypothetical protein
MSRAFCQAGNRSAMEPRGRRFLAFCWLAVIPLVAIPGLTVSQDREKAPAVRELEDPLPLKDVVVRVVENPNAVVGQPSVIRLEVFNPNRSDLDKVSLVARLHDQLAHRSRGNELVTSLVSLAPNEKVLLDLVVTPQQNGKFPVDLTLFAADKLTTNTNLLVVAEEGARKVKFITPEFTGASGFATPPLPMIDVPGTTHWVATVDGRTPARELLPPVPQSLLSRSRYLLPGKLDEVTEIAFQEPLRPDREKSLNDTRLLVSKILHMHTKKADSYMEELIAYRPDLQGMPFTLGAACRSDPERMMHFSGVLQAIRGSMGGDFSQPLTAVVLARRETNDAVSDQFWQNFNTQLIPKITEVDKRGRDKTREMFREAHVAALMQVCGPEQGAMRKGLTRHVAGVPHVSSSRALAKLAIFSPEDDVRREAIDALRVRKDRDYADVLVAGLNYPWPEVAKRSADAIIQLERKDLIPALVDMLDEADPRLPKAVEAGGRKTHVVNEMVRLNHHRNCFMCHPPAPAAGSVPPGDPAPSPDGSTGLLTGAVPIPGEPLPSFQEGYRNSTPELAVRIDVTYLRQDFSVFMKVDGPGLWPEMQRFDFLVRTREVTNDEMEAFKKITATAAEEGVLTPYQRAAVTALRELTGRDAAPNAEAWRRILKLPARGT